MPFHRFARGCAGLEMRKGPDVGAFPPYPPSPTEVGGEARHAHQVESRTAQSYADRTRAAPLTASPWTQPTGTTQGRTRPKTA